MRDPDYVLTPFTVVDEQTKAAGMRAAGTAADTPLLVKQPGETNTAFNARVTQFYKDQPQPTLTPDQVAAGATVQFVRTGASGVGEYKIVYPLGQGFNPATGKPIGTNVFENLGFQGGGVGGIGLGNNIATGTNTGPTLASDVFKQTLAVFFGPTEMAKPWANELYTAVSKFYKQGATSEEAFNMALLESENNPTMADFTKRFKGIFALQKMKQAGKAVTVPTIAEYFATESKMGDILRASNLGELANEDFLGDVLSKGINATQFGDRIVDIFDRIDNAPDSIKKTIGRFFPTLDRIQLAKALATGEKGAKQLQQELAGYEVLSAAEQQGLGASSMLPGGITSEQALQIAKGGGTFASTLGQFGQIAAVRETEQKLAEISGVKSMGVSGLVSAVIGKSAKELKALEDLSKQEQGRFSGQSGNIGSKAFASQSRAAGLI